jgi:glycosyltransferase involved in cell wall biosynthesis
VSDRRVICMFVRNTFQHDARVRREANTLIEEGFDVVVFAVTNKPEEVGESTEGQIRIVRITLPTAVSSFVRFLGRIVGLYARAAGLGRRALRRTRRTAPAAPPEGLRTSTEPVAYTKRPAGVAAVDNTRRAIRNVLWPAHRFLQGRKYGRIAGARAAALKPVAYHCHDLNSILAGFQGRSIHPAPVIYDAHELWPHRNRPDARRRKTWILSKADRYFCRRCDAVITVNDSIARHMEKKYGIPEVVVVRNIPSLAARSAPPEHGVLADLPTPRLVYVGGIQTFRGLEQVIVAMPMIRDAVFAAIGPGDPDYRRGLEKLAVDHGVADRVRFVEWVPPESVVATVGQGDLGMCLFQASHLSYYWTLPNKFFEYLHAGVPVLASDFPETRRLVDRYEVGAVCDPGDPAGIATAVNDLLSRPDDLVRMRDNALKAAQELNWEHERERLLGLYRRLVPSVRG